MNRFTRVAVEAAKKAGEFSRKRLENLGYVKQKNKAFDIVTEVDVETQKLIILIIKKYFPSHEIMAEEKDNNNIDFGNFLWVIDPIDGTSAYAAGLPTYSCSIALLKDKKTICAAMYLAMTNEVIFAQSGKGTNVSSQKLKVKSQKLLRKAVVGFDPGYPPREEHMRDIASILSDKVRILPLIWSQAASLALVAKGVFDGFIQCGSPKPWDAAAGKLLVEEAGGIVTDFKGEPVDIFNIKGYVAGSKRIYKELLEYLKNI